MLERNKALFSYHDILNLLLGPVTGKKISQFKLHQLQKGDF